MSTNLKRRLKALGIGTGELAARIGVSADTMTRGLGGNPAHVGAWIDALEIMTPEMRAAWLKGRPD